MILHNCQLIAPLLCLLSEGGKALCLTSYVCMLATYFCFPSKQCKGTFCHKYFTFTMISLFIFTETLDDLDIQGVHKQFIILQTPCRPGNGVTERRCHATRDVWRCRPVCQLQTVVTPRHEGDCGHNAHEVGTIKDWKIIIYAVSLSNPI